MEARFCKCGCGKPMSDSNRWEYQRGHKPKFGTKTKSPGTALAKHEPVVEIDEPVNEEPESVECIVTVPQMDAIYALLTPRQKACAVLTGIGEEA
jgi:hypothetical protein